MSLRIYAVVLELVRRVSPRVSVVRARSSELGNQLQVIGTLVRLIEPRPRG
jgi:hypothetical protein